MTENYNQEQIANDLRAISNKNTISSDMLTFYFKIVKDWVNGTPDSLYLGCAKNNLDDIVVILYRYNTIYLLGKTYKTIMYAPKIMFHWESCEHLHIDDVLMKHNNSGNGSVAMQALLKYAKENGAKVITGSLSNVDDEHKSRRDHYYEKFGFEVTEHYIKKLLA